MMEWLVEGGRAGRESGMGGVDGVTWTVRIEVPFRLAV